MEISTIPYEIGSEQLNFSSATPVISGAQKFVIPISSLPDGEPLVYPYDVGEQAGQSIVDWQGNPIGDTGVVFYNGKDSSYQAIKGDGNGVIIINNVTEQQSNELLEQIGGPRDLSLIRIKEVLNFAYKTLGLNDMYNSTKEFIASKMSLVGKDASIEAYGLYKRDDRDICYAVYIPGDIAFKGPATTPQIFHNGAVILKQREDIRGIQPDIFEKTYRHANGNPIKISDLVTQNIESKKRNWIDLVSDVRKHKDGPSLG